MGGSGSDVQTGNIENDVLYGGDGNDRLVGGGGMADERQHDLIVGQSSHRHAWFWLVGGGHRRLQWRRQDRFLWQNASTGRVQEWQMNGATVASSPDIITLTPGAWSVKGTGDFNGDGKSDILLQNTSSGAVVEWQMNGGTILSSVNLPTVPVGSGWSEVGIGDFNGDGKADILWKNASTGTVEEWLMNGGTITSAPDIITLKLGAWNILAGSGP
jgi:Ca2+-binding RTX toxin-like protein